MIMGILQPNAEPRRSTLGLTSAKSSGMNASRLVCFKSPTASSNDMALRFREAKIDSLSASSGSSTLLPLLGLRNTTMSARLALRARRSARQNGDPCRNGGSEKLLGAVAQNVVSNYLVWQHEMSPAQDCRGEQLLGVAARNVPCTRV